MPHSKPLVIVTRKLPDPVETRMMELFQARLNLSDVPMSQEQLAAAMREADVLVPTVTDRIDAALIEQAGERLKLIANFGNGVDHIDVEAAAQKQITVTNTPNVLTEDTADMTMGLILTVPRRLIEGAGVLKGDGKWGGWSPTWMLGHRIWGCLLYTSDAADERSRTSWRRPIGKASIRCWPAWTSSPSIVRPRRPHSICCRHGVWR